jgi:multisubunit Na+/H+ antiporter MnhB subunit
MKDYKLLPKITLWSLIGLGILFIAMFFFGGSNGSLEVAGDFLDIPRFTDAFLCWNYILFALVVLITLAVVVVDFANNWKTNRRKAYMTLGVVCGFIVLALICWFLGSPEKVNIIGYEGTDNVGFWAQMSDAVIYACYTLVIATIGTMIWGYCYTKKLSK